MQRDKCTHTERKRENFLCSCFRSSGFLPSFRCVSHPEALKEAGSRLRPPEHLCPYLCFPLQRSQFDFTACRKWQPAGIPPVFYKGNSLAVQGACRKHEESIYVLTTGVQDIHSDQWGQPQFPCAFNPRSVWKGDIHHKEVNWDHIACRKALNHSDSCS